MSTRLKSFLSTGVLTLVAAGAAQATELCVKCTGPDASYACIVGDRSNATLDTVAKFYCITTLAKAGSHASCSINREMTPPCPGERKELPIPAFLDGSGDGDQPQDASPTGQTHTNPRTQEAKAPPPEPEIGATAPRHDQPPGPPASDQPPKTVQEMVEKSASGLSGTQKSAGEAAKSASTALEKAGSAVGGAAKSSWKCLSSFFSNC